MKRRTLLIWALVLLVVGLLGLVALDYLLPRYADLGDWCPWCGRRDGRERTQPRGRDGTRGWSMGPGMMGPGSFMMRDYSKDKYESNGEQIFLTGRSRSGRSISSDFGMMRLGCANCHGADGSGGLAFPDGSTSADIRWAALTKDEHMGEGDIRTAIADGVDEDGKPLSQYMPRWRMDQQDLDDLIKYLKTL